MCVLETIRWGSSATHPATVANLQNSGRFDNPRQTYSFANIGGTGYWNIAVPTDLGPINVVSFNGSPLYYVPLVDVVSSSVTANDTLAAALTFTPVATSLPMFVSNGALYSIGSTVSINDGSGNTLSGTVSSIINNTIIVTVTATTGTGVSFGQAVVITTGVTYNVYRSDASFPGFDGMSITAL